MRREILWLIWDQELAAGAIASAFEVTAPTISQHLSVLREAGLVTVQVEGSFRRYRARPDVLQGLQSLIIGEGSKWTVADDIPERRHSETRRAIAVITSVVVTVDRAAAFRAFTDPVIYSRWLGVPVFLEDRRFACTLEWGTRVRGTYEEVIAPSLIAIKWDFEDDNVPVPGGEMTGYIRFFPQDDGTRVEVHQLLDSPDHVPFMEAAWGMVLGRFSDGMDNTDPPGRRAPRRKRRA